MKRILITAALLLMIALTLSACANESSPSATTAAAPTEAAATAAVSAEATEPSPIIETTVPSVETKEPATEPAVTESIQTESSVSTEPAVTEPAQPIPSAVSTEPFQFTGNKEEDFANLAGEWHADSEAFFQLTVWPDGRFILKNQSDTWEGTLQLDEESIAEGYLPAYYPVPSSGERIPEMGTLYTIDRGEEHYLFLGFAGENFPFIR